MVDSLLAVSTWYSRRAGNFPGKLPRALWPCSLVVLAGTTSRWRNGGQSEIVSTEAYWDAQDATYATEVFVVWKECTNGSLDAALDAAAQTRRSAETIAVDFGTGPGFALRGLSGSNGALASIFRRHSSRRQM